MNALRNQPNLKIPVDRTRLLARVNTATEPLFCVMPFSHEVCMYLKFPSRTDPLFEHHQGTQRRDAPPQWQRQTFELRQMRIHKLGQQIHVLEAKTQQISEKTKLFEHH